MNIRSNLNPHWASVLLFKSLKLKHCPKMGYY